MKLNYFLVIILIILTISGCRKENTYPPPAIEYYLPKSDDQFELPDTIPVVAKVSAETTIESIKVQLTDSEFNPSLPAITLFPNSTNYTVNLQYPITNNSLVPGKYYILIRADIEDNFKNQYQRVQIKNDFSFDSRLLILTKPAQNKIDLYYYENNTGPNKVLVIDADYTSSDVNPFNNQLFIAGENITNVQAWDLESLTLAWQIQNIPYQPMHNPGCLFFDELLYTSFNYLYILGFKPSGDINFNTNIGENDAPGRIFRNYDFILVDIQNKGISSSKLNTYYAGTSGLKQEIFTNFKVVEFFSLNVNTALIFANNGIIGKIIVYDIASNTLNEVNEIDEKITCVGKSTFNSFYFIGTNNSVRLYEQALNYFHEDLRNVGADHIDFNQKTGELYISVNNLVDIYNYPEMEYQKTLWFSDTILNIHTLISQQAGF